jgi:transcriptional regulator with XRE-family HTH domain
MSGAKMDLGTVIRVIRKARGLKQQDLAREAGISGNYLCFIESGRRDPTIAVLSRLAGALRIPMAMVFVLQEAGDDELEAIDLDKIVELLNRRIPMCAPLKLPKKPRPKV